MEMNWPIVELDEEVDWQIIEVVVVVEGGVVVVVDGGVVVEGMNEWVFYNFIQGCCLLIVLEDW